MRGLDDVFAALAAFVVFPNVIFIVVGRALMINRAWFSIDYALLGAVWLFLPFPLRIAGFVLIAAIDFIGSTAAIFNMGSMSALAMLRFAPQAVLQDSVIGLLLLVVAFILNLWLAARFVCDRRRLVAIVLLSFVVVTATTDAMLGGSRFIAKPHVGDINLTASTTVRFVLDSRERLRAERNDPVLMRAASDSLRSRSTHRYNTLVVLVESMGVTRDVALQRVLWQAITEDSVIATRYRLRTGDVDFRGGTTSGELRELCGALADYLTLPSEQLPKCLPAQMAAHGFETFALHGYKQRFYGRGAWYNQMFQHAFFYEQLGKVTPHRRCGTAFKGICDRDVMRTAAHILRTGNRRFVYVVTLDSHLPVDFTRRVNFACTARREVCTEVQIWRDVVEQVALIARERTTRILVVGDHAPPFGRPISDAFEPGHVAFMELIPK